MFTIQPEGGSVYVLPASLNRMSVFAHTAKLAIAEPDTKITVSLAGIVRFIVKDGVLISRAPGKELPCLLTMGETTTKNQVEHQQLRLMFWSINPSMCGQLVNSRINATPRAIALEADYEEKITRNDAAEYAEVYKSHLVIPHETKQQEY